MKKITFLVMTNTMCRYVRLVKRVRAKFSKNCAFCDTSIIFTVRFHFDMRTKIIYGTISEIDVVDQKFRVFYILLLNSNTFKK